MHVTRHASLLSACLFLLTLPLGAATVTWTGAGGDVNWSTGGNWLAGNPPAASGDLLVFVNAGSGSTSANADTPWSINRISFNNNLAGSFTLSGGALTLAVGDSFFNDNTDRLKTVTVGNDLVLAGRSTFYPSQVGVGGRISTILAGDISGPGAMRVFGPGGGSTATVPEIVLAGANTWTGSFHSVVDGINTGPGGLMIGGGQRNAYVRFDSPGALPTGNAGQVAYLAALRQDNNVDYQRGFIFTGGETEQVYDPAVNLKFLIGGRATAYPARGAIGSNGGVARLEGAEVIVFSGDADRALGLGLLVFDGTLTLGSAGKPVLFQSAWRAADSDSGLTGAASTLNEVTTSNMALVKIGAGTLALDNVGYTQLNGSTDKTNKFYWQIAAGAVRGLSNTDPARNPSNSLFPAVGAPAPPFSAIPAFSGGVYEVDNRSGNGGMFTAKLNVSGPDAISLQSGGGFAAYGNDVAVSLDTDLGSDTIRWEWYTHPGDTRALIFGSLTANAKITLTNPIQLRFSKEREFRIVDNPNSSADIAELSGVISQLEGTASIRKTGDGTLMLSAPNTYAGGTTVAAGTLLVNNVTGSGTGSGLVTVNAGATLGGTGRLAGNTTISPNATVAPGNSIGTLTFGGDLDLAGIYDLEIDKVLGTSDLLAVAGVLSLDDAVLDISYWAYQAGEQLFLIASATGGITGSFATVISPAGYRLALLNNNTELWLAIPEPTSLALLALAGLAARRRRRR